MQPYDHKKIEPKWQKKWDKEKAFKALDFSDKKKFYSLIEFPFASGDGMHVGHIRSNTAMDIISRKRRAEGYNVLYPIGWDSFGLPTENYAIKTGTQPAIIEKKNTDNFRRQLKALGFSFDWSREINTTDPKYYKWTQWIFLQFLKKGLAYKKKMTINWCPKDLIGLANEEVIDGKCERCGTPVEKREKEQWMLAITKYADRLDSDLDGVDYLPQIKTQQRNWIGKSEGAEFDFRLAFTKIKLKFVLIHGFKGNPDDAFLPWLKAELEKRGHEVIVPKLPNTEDPKESEQVDYVLKNCNLDEHTVVIGHSLGAVVAMKAIMKLNKPISGFTIVASAVDPNFNEIHTEHKARIFHKNFAWDFDYERINKLAGGKIAILSDTRETNRAPYLKYLSGKLSAYLIEAESAEKHFNGAIEPLLLQCVTLSIRVFTTRPDTLFGVTYIVLAPENPYIGALFENIENKKEVEEYIAKTKKQADIERTDAKREKTGVELKGICAVNPANGEKVPVWIADYVLADYGSGAVMAVPAHDERDFEFAKKYHLPSREVIQPETGIPQNNPEFRKSIVAIVRDPMHNTFLSINWGKLGGNLFVGGGREGDEDVIECAKREVAEETGYADLKFIRKTGIIYHNYFAQSKNVARRIEAQAVLFDVVGDATNAPKLEKDEQGKFTVEWLPASVVESNIKDELHKVAYQLLVQEKPYTGDGILLNSAEMSGLSSSVARPKITEQFGMRKTSYRLRDWIFSRQRYWGEPIPVIHCEKCGIVPVPEKDLPVKLPPVKNYQPTQTGESPLAAISKWVNVKCPHCKGKARRETDTMPNWAGSSWYYLRFADPKNAKAFAAKDKLKYWTPVDWYNGGMEHTTLHLLYSRFWHKFLFDQGLVPTSEPYMKRTSHGLILAKGGEKMSKSKGNVVNPDGIVEVMGADSLRLYEMFMGPFDQAIAWDENGIVGCRRFLERVWKLAEKVRPTQTSDKEAGQKAIQQNRPGPTPGGADAIVHKTIKKVSEDIEAMRFNTAVSSLMIAVNELEKISEKSGGISAENYSAILQLLAPFAPHITEELWSVLGFAKGKSVKSVHSAPWPVFDPSKIAEATVRIAVQVNGKTRGGFEVSIEEAGQMTEAQSREKALALDEIAKWVYGKDIKKVIYVKGRLINIVIA
jgi:leucyl-tRNA synthetase